MIDDTQIGVDTACVSQISSSIVYTHFSNLFNSLNNILSGILEIFLTPIYSACVYHSLFNQPSIDKHLNFYQAFVIRESSVINHVQKISFHVFSSVIFRMYCQKQIVGSRSKRTYNFTIYCQIPIKRILSFYMPTRNE